MSEYAHLNPYARRTNASLGDLLRKVAENPRSFSAADRAALLTVAADRLDPPETEAATERVDPNHDPLRDHPLLDRDDVEPIDYEGAYRKGWDASTRTKTYDLDAAEARFERRHGEWYTAAFNRGWNDYAADRSFDPSRTDDERDAESGC